MSTYRERREARAGRLREWAEKRDAKAAASYAAAQQTADAIPMGQPMLTGHYSYRSDRNRRDKMHRNFERSFEHAAKAREMESKAANIESAAATAIYSDDPDAIEQLAAKIARLEAERGRIKAYNASCRKGAPDPSLLDERQRAGLASVLRFSPQRCKDGRMPAYALTNLSGNISRLRKRLKQLSAKHAASTLQSPR